MASACRAIVRVVKQTPATCALSLSLFSPRAQRVVVLPAGILLFPVTICLEMWLCRLRWSIAQLAVTPAPFQAGEGQWHMECDTLATPSSPHPFLDTASQPCSVSWSLVSPLSCVRASLRGSQQSRKDDGPGVRQMLNCALTTGVKQPSSSPLAT